MLTNATTEASATAAEELNRLPELQLERGGEGIVARLKGVWTTRTVASVDRTVRKLESGLDASKLTLDLSGIVKMDTAGAWLVERMIQSAEARGAEVRLAGMTPASRTLLGAVAEAVREGAPPPAAGRLPLLQRALESIGRTISELIFDIIKGLHILGATVSGAQMKKGRGHAINPAAIFNQIDQTGVRAIPVVILMAAIVGAIVAQQGAFQLRYFGAEIFVVDLVGILVLREMGVLLTAIMIAGRSGSAITAEIGSMKMREEVDALKVIGLNPVGVLVFPRLVALVIALPLLTIAANFAALGGAILVSWFYSDISPTAFIDRLHESIDLSTIAAGLIKAPFMAMIIGIIASVEGLSVGGSAESLGRHVTNSVVKAIFMVIILDGAFAMFYAAIDF